MAGVDSPTNPLSMGSSNEATFLININLMTLPFSASHLVLFSPYIFPPPPNMPHRTTNVLLIISNLVTISPLLFLIHHPTLISGTTTFTISNNCPFTIWPGTLAGSGTPPLSSTGFQLDPGKSVKLIPSTPGWSGRIWARTGCRFDKSGTGTCDTGDCGGKMECGGSGANPPASLFEITLGKGMNTEDKDFYDVSLVDGYNLPILAWPVTGSSSSSCNATGCAYDLNTGCPKELQVVGGTNRNGLQQGSSGGDQPRSGGVIACKSACEAFGQDQYCCSGEYGNPTTCKPSVYSTIFKKACPRAYSYAYDDKTSTFTCTQADNYVILFCPTPTRGAPSDGGTFATPPPIPSSPPPQALQPQPPPQAPPPPLLQPPMLHPPPQASTLQPPPEAVLQPPPLQAPSPPLPESPSSKGDNMGVDTSSSPIILQPIIYVPILLLRVLSLILF